MKVISFLSTLPDKTLVQPDNSKTQTLRYFVEGVNAAGDSGQIRESRIYESCDVAVMLGWVHEDGKRAPHLSFRQEILDRQKSKNSHTVIADSNLFLYKNKKNPGYFLRYSFDGVFPDTGIYCDDKIDPNRWTKISQAFDLGLRDYRSDGTHVLMCLQRDGGWSMGPISVIDWTLQTLTQLRQHTNRPIRIRPHPGDKKGMRHCQELERLTKIHNIRDVSMSINEDYCRDLKHAWAVVNHNSSPGVGALIEGVPVFQTDAARSQCREVANTDLSRIENPQLFDREPWLHRISQFHWSWEEIRDGTAWRHMRQWI